MARAWFVAANGANLAKLSDDATDRKSNFFVLVHVTLLDCTFVVGITYLAG